jgi:hypothetical protein
MNYSCDHKPNRRFRSDMPLRVSSRDFWLELIRRNHMDAIGCDIQSRIDPRLIRIELKRSARRELPHASE